MNSLATPITRYGYENATGHRLLIEPSATDFFKVSLTELGEFSPARMAIPNDQAPTIALAILRAAGVILAPESITINRAEDAPSVALDALELHGVPPTDTGGWRTAMEQSFKETSDTDLVYTAWLHLKALSLRTARKQAATEAAAAEKEAAEKLTRRRDELAQELVPHIPGITYGTLATAGIKLAIDMIIQLQDEAAK